MFPEGTATYPLTGGIHIELTIAILLFVISIISRLELRRLIHGRHNKNKDEASAEERACRMREKT